MKKKPSKKSANTVLQIMGPPGRLLMERIYRRQLKFEKMLLNQTALIRLDVRDMIKEIAPHVETIRKLTDHCARLLKEKSILARRCDELTALHEPTTALHDGALVTNVPVRNSWLWRPGIGWEKFISGTCEFADKHQFNQTCPICGHLEISP